MPALPPILTTLFGNWIDYAGRFPPANLPLTSVLKNYLDYAAGPHAWLLHRLVLRLDELPPVNHWLAQQHPDREPTPVSVLCDPHQAAAEQAHQIFTQLDRLSVVSVETKWDDKQHEAVRALRALVEHVYVEVPAGSASRDTLAQLSADQCHAKLRSGGIRAESIPSSREIVAFMAACRSADIAYKLTAGLHHAWRGEYPLTYQPGAPAAAMHGFVQVALTALMLEQDPGRVVDAVNVLDAPAPESLVLADDHIQWGGDVFDLAAARHLRSRRFHSVGSCSFDEPLQDLLHLGSRLAAARSHSR